MKHINYIGPFNRTGYGIANCGYAYGLIKQAQKEGVTVSFVPIGQIDQNDPELKRPEYQGILQAMTVQPIWEEPTFCFWHLSHIKHYLSNAKGLKVGLSTFETDVLMPAEIEGAKDTNLLLTACSHSTKIVEKHGIKSKVLPHGCAFDKIPNQVPEIDPIKIWEQELGYSLTNYRILSTVGKFEERKGFRELVSALNLLSDNYLLVAFWHNPFMEHGYPIKYLIEENCEPVVTKSGLKAFKKNNVTILMMPSLPTREHLYNTIRTSHFYVCTSKAEGWNLPLFDALSIGLPCISTTNSAMADYAGDNVISISSGQSELAVDGQFFHGNRGNWEKLDIKLIAEKIDGAFKLNPRELANKSYKAISALNYTWSELGSKLYKIISDEQRTLE
jgi:glycosyltransferase involved in cell wall biosynthesis